MRLLGHKHNLTAFVLLEYDHDFSFDAAKVDIRNRRIGDRFAGRTFSIAVQAKRDYFLSDIVLNHRKRLDDWMYRTGFVISDLQARRVEYDALLLTPRLKVTLWNLLKLCERSAHKIIRLYRLSVGGQNRKCSGLWVEIYVRKECPRRMHDVAVARFAIPS